MGKILVHKLGKVSLDHQNPHEKWVFRGMPLLPVLGAGGGQSQELASQFALLNG